MISAIIVILSFILSVKHQQLETRLSLIPIIRNQFRATDYKYRQRLKRHPNNLED